MGIVEDPKNFKLNIDLERMIATTTKRLLWEFTDVFTWNYKKLRGIPSHIVDHKIELDTTNPPSHQAHYYMNPTIWQSSNKTLIGFIKLLEHKFGWIAFNLAKFG
jgi:hypothetical protein